MVLKLYGTPRSPYVRLVAAILLEKQVPFELVVLDMSKSEQKSLEYLSKQPFGQVPCIVWLPSRPLTSLESYFFLTRQDDDGFILYESRAICYYIASKYADQGPSLLPTGIKANALYQQAVFTEISHFNEHALAAAREMLAKP